jgi:hypothetical protein
MVPAAAREKLAMKIYKHQPHHHHEAVTRERAHRCISK